MKKYLFIVAIALAILGIGNIQAETAVTQVIQSGTAVLSFNGQNTAISNIQFSPVYNQPPVVVCSASNEWAAGVLVGCQALTGEFGGVSAELPYTTTLTLDVNWIAIGDMPIEKGYVPIVMNE